MKILYGRKARYNERKSDRKTCKRGREIMGFENEFVNAFNKYFENISQTSTPLGIAYRNRQAEYVGQKLDIIVDHPSYYLGIEEKSKDISGKQSKLYFSRDFSSRETENGEIHQVQYINEFLQRSGRKGYLLVVLKRGKGKQQQAYFIDWGFVINLWVEGVKGIDLTTLDENKDKKYITEVKKRNGEWEIPSSIIPDE